MSTAYEGHPIPPIFLRNKPPTIILIKNMTTKTNNLLNGILSLILLIPLPTLIINVYQSFQAAGHIIIFNEVFLDTGSYLILAGMALFAFYLLYKSLYSLSSVILPY